jgi:CRP-like cAMP-binding protein
MIVDTLKKSTVFSSLKEKELKAVSAFFEKKSYKKNDKIFHEGDTSEWFYLVGEGEVKILKHTITGKDIILEVMAPGDIFGGVAVLDNSPFPANAQAMDAVTVIRISRWNLLKIMEEYPILKLEVVKYFSGKLRDAHEMLKDLATERVEKRIAALLIRLAEKAGVSEKGYKKINFPITRQELAEMAGTTVETCIRTTSKFQKLGLIKSSNNRIMIKPDLFKKLLDE